MVLTRRLFLLVGLTLALSGSGRAQRDFYLKPNDRVVFYGDSITEQRLYTAFTETFVVTRFPKYRVAFTHSGVGGDRVTGGWMGPVDARLDRDVIPYRPTVMTIMLGMNDGAYRPFDAGIFDTYARGYEHILDRMKTACPGIRFTLIVPSPFDDVTRKPNWDPGYNAVLVRYGEFVKELAQKQRQTVADLNGPLVAMLERANATDPALAQKIIPDRVHPGPGGHLIMAESLLKSWHAPALVSAVAIDARTARVAKAENAKVTDIAATGGALAWEQTDGSLPFPIDEKDPALMLAVKSSDFIEALDQQTLSVTGLAADRYTLKIDGTEVGSFSKAELASGVNLAVQPTPMVEQARAVHALTWKRLELHQTRWRSVQWPLLDTPSPALDRALAALDALDAEIAAKQREAAQPKPHKFELTPV
jgi:lysophospholipase L1-like esterase